MHLTSHIIAHMAMPPYIAHYRSNWFDQRFLFRFRLFGNNPPNAHRSQIKMCEKRQTQNVQFRFMQNAFRILKPIQKSSICVWVFRNTGAKAFAKNQIRLAYEDKRDLYCVLIWSDQPTRGGGWMGGPEFGIQYKCRAYSWFDKWKSTLIQ